MSGSDIRPGPDDLQIFRTVNVARTRRTYSRACTVVVGDFILVRVPLMANGQEDHSGLTEEQKRFVQTNTTPAEWAATVGRRRCSDCAAAGCQ